MESQTADPVTLVVNGSVHTVDAKSWTLARLLREQLGEVAVKVGCEEGSCGACTVLLDGSPVPSCAVPVGLCEGVDVQTPDWLAEHDPSGRQVAAALTACSAMQCGFCTPGILTTLTWLARRPLRDGDVIEHDEAALAVALEGHLCRCTGYARYLDVARELLS